MNNISCYNIKKQKKKKNTNHEYGLSFKAIGERNNKMTEETKNSETKNYLKTLVFP